MIIVYGLKTCDTCRKALKWLMEEGIAHRFHDLRADGVPEEALSRWLAQLGWSGLVNQRSTTWRGLPAGTAEGLDDAGAAALIRQYPALVKRPLFDTGSAVAVGFKEAEKTWVRQQVAAPAAS